MGTIIKGAIKFLTLWVCRCASPLVSGSSWLVSFSIWNRVSTANSIAGWSTVNIRVRSLSMPAASIRNSEGFGPAQTIKHNMRNAVWFYVDGSGVCPACKNVYHTRYRVLTHIQNRKKPECKLYILHGGSARALPKDFAQELDELDNNAIREARKQGHTHPKVKAPARRADGTCIGCART